MANQYDVTFDATEEAEIQAEIAGQSESGERRAEEKKEPVVATKEEPEEKEEPAAEEEDEEENQGESGEQTDATKTPEGKKGDQPEEKEAIDFEFEAPEDKTPEGKFDWDKVAEEVGIAERGDKVKEKFKALAEENKKLLDQVEAVKIFAQSGSIIADLDKILAMDDEDKLREHLKREGKTQAQIDKRIALYENNGVLEEKALDIDDLIIEAKTNIMENAEKFRKEQVDGAQNKKVQFSEAVIAEISKIEKVAGIALPTDTSKRNALNNQVVSYFKGDFQKRLEDPAQLAKLCAADALLPQLEKMITDRVKSSVKEETIQRHGNVTRPSKSGVIRPDNLAEEKDAFENELDAFEKSLGKTPLRGMR